MKKVKGSGSLGGLLVLFGLMIAGSEIWAAVQSWHVDSGSTKFLAVGRPSLLKIHGEGTGPKGDLAMDDKNVVSGKLEMDLSSFKTGIDMRDGHMKDKYLQVEKYPKAVLTLTRFVVPPVDQLPKEVPFEGSLTLHGETQAIKDGTVLLTKAGEKIAFVAKFKLTITQYKIDIPSYAGVKVAESVDVEVQSEAAATTSK